MSQVDQDEGREGLTRTVAAASLAVSSVYIAWRWGWTLDGEHPWFSLPLVLAETYGLLAAALLTYTAWTLRRRTPPPPLPGRTVDVFVTVAHEPLAIIRKTVLAAREIRYPHTTWLLDDGHRDELRAVADEVGIRYLRREDRAQGKAGNLNHALHASTGEFLLQLDADHVPLPHIVDRLVGFFEDDRVAVAQSPQDFYNTDAFSDDAAGRGRQLWGDQQLFFNVLQPGKDRVNAALFVGSCAMLRRAAIAEIGGFATETTTVGTETSLLLHARGWRTVYLNESLAFGLAPSTAHAYLQQQLHRAQGGMRMLRRYQPLAMPGLSLAQRLEYFQTLTTPLGGVQRLVIYLAPIVFLTTGVFPIRASVGTFAAFFLPAALLRAASFKLLTRGQGSLLLSDRYWMAKFFTHALAVRAWLTPRRLAYGHRASEAGAVPLRTVAPQLVLIGVTAAALAWATYARSLGFAAEVPGWGILALAAAVLLALWHAGLAAHVVQLSLAGRHRRAEHRFTESLSVALRVLRPDGKLASTDIAMTEDLTATGLALRCMYPVPDGARVELSLPLSGGEVHVRGHVVRHAVSETQLGTVHRMGVEFDGTTREVRDAIELHCAQHAMPMEQQRRGAIGASALRRLRELRGERRVDVGMPARVFEGADDAAAADLGVGLLEDVSPRGGRVVLDHPVSEGSRITVQIPGSAVRASGRVVFVHALETALGMRFVAGFQTEGAGPAPATAAPWHAAVLRLMTRAGLRVAEGSRTAATRLAEGSRATAGQLATVSRAAAEKTAAASRAASEAAGKLAAPIVRQVLARGQAEAAAAAPAPAMEPDQVAVPAEDPERAIEMEIDGQFSFPFELSVGATLLITESGAVSADISAVHAIVLGSYTGTLRATRSIRVGPAARVEGTLEAPHVDIAPGAVVNGLRAGDETGVPTASTDTVTKLDGETAAQGPDDLTKPGSSVEGGPRPDRPSQQAAGPDGEPAPGADDEIFVASPVFTEGVSR